jgi:predicted phosphodiesterase
MRLALISDLHANIVALDAVLNDARRAGFDQLVCLGDVARRRQPAC